SSLVRALIFFVFKKRKKKLRLIINYKGFNEIIKKNYYLLPLIVKLKKILYKA
ncbi:hypothetical protein CORC01_09854, partial [Colletotrichum orchidophilum]